MTKISTFRKILHADSYKEFCSEGTPTRDLKHLIFFEDLLQEANNDLVKQAKNEGKRALGYTCYFMPEVLLDLPGCFSVRLRAPRCTSPEIATYYLSSRTCHYGRSLMERAFPEKERQMPGAVVYCRQRRRPYPR